MPDKPPDFSDFKRFPLTTISECLVVVGLWVAAGASDGWPAVVLFVLAPLLSLHLAVTAVSLRNAAQAIREYEKHEALRRVGKRPRRGWTAE